MASSGPLLFALPLVLLISLAFLASAQTDDSTFQIAGDTLNQYEMEGVSFYDEELAEGMEEEIIHGASTRRSLFWGRVMRYYISFGALSANRIPCPSRSGRSYYTHNCYRARGPVHPYTRGCSAITRCRRFQHLSTWRKNEKHPSCVLRLPGKAVLEIDELRDEWARNPSFLQLLKR